MTVDLQLLLHEPWCRTCVGPACQRNHTVDELQLVDGFEDEQLSLAERLPECVPPGLEWQSYGSVASARWEIDHKPITDEQAERQYIGHIAIEFCSVAFDCDCGVYTATVDGHIGEGDSKCAALTAALHRLADEREKVDA